LNSADACRISGRGPFDFEEERPFLKRLRGEVLEQLFLDEGVSALSESVSSARFLDIWRRPGGELCDRLGDRERDGATGLGKFGPTKVPKEPTMTGDEVIDAGSGASGAIGRDSALTVIVRGSVSAM